MRVRGMPEPWRRGRDGKSERGKTACPPPFSSGKAPAVFLLSLLPYDPRCIHRQAHALLSSASVQKTLGLPSPTPMPEKNADLHGNAPDSSPVALVIVD